MYSRNCSVVSRRITKSIPTSQQDDVILYHTPHVRIAYIMNINTTHTACKGKFFRRNLSIRNLTAVVPFIFLNMNLCTPQITGVYAVVCTINLYVDRRHG